MFYFKCENDHDGHMSLSNLKKGTGCGECLGFGLDIEKKIEILEEVHQGILSLPFERLAVKMMRH